MLDCFERALQHFGTRVEIVTAMEMANKIATEDAYQMIKDELKELKNTVKNLRKMPDDSLKIHENDDGSFSMEWDREDQKWNWLNDLTSAEIETMLQEAIRNYGGTQ
jgi:hypothetical protein